MKHFKIILSLAIILLISQNVKAQPIDSLRHIIDISLEKMEQNSLHKKDIDWVAFKKMVYAETKGITHVNTLLNKFPLMFKELNDFHGSIFDLKNKEISWKEGRPKKEWSEALDSGFRRSQSLKSERWEDIGYFRVPSAGAVKPEIIKRATQIITDTLCRINPSTIKGLIVDLRLNTGGNIWVMLPSLSSTIGDGKIGGVKFVDKREATYSLIKDGKPFANNEFYSIPEQHCELPNSSIPVVILVGAATRSSGEGLLLAFKGRPNTLIIGEPTGGYITSNSVYEIHKGIYLSLATGYMTDRTGKAYTESIQPDILINGGDNFFELDKDAKILAAKKWLNSKINKI